MSQDSVSGKGEFKPKIIAFCCNWCSYAGADLAGISRFQYPPNIRVVRVMCSGRVDPTIVLETLGMGADGIMILGCHPGDCHYQTGNYEAEKKFELIQELARLAGLEEDRLILEWVSAGEGARFAGIVRDFTERIQGLGPTPAGSDSIKRRLDSAVKAASTFRLRTFVAKKRELTEDQNIYGEKFTDRQYDLVFKPAIKEEYARARVLDMIEDHKIGEIAEELRIDTKRVVRLIGSLRREGKVTLDHMEEGVPVFKSITV